jgi:hypothetical protein
MTVTFDEASGHWRVVTRDGSVIEDGFTSNTAAWRSLDQHCEDEIADDATRVRIGNAIQAVVSRNESQMKPIQGQRTSSAERTRAHKPRRT